MARLNIVLIEPQIPQNTGNIVRTCAATNAVLHLVEPMGFKIEDKKLKRAGLDYWNLMEIHRYGSTEEFFEKNKDGNFFYFTTKGLNRHTDATYPDNCYLVFGREDAGLPEALLFENKEHCVRVPMQNDARSLNLSNTVAIAVYEVLRQWDYPELKTAGSLTKYNWQEE
ncbi:MAG: tRNA (uridine(34)/cytosine(34)/5-carboxymethylaminomethyluridine(34)-2'-O)-methyltransferase TrmL [Clostridia bacterium]|nr:tRNA (uridine(34)/cytosine(34)/5-carboxymethylaminomethyluridine(34)-2'-O)-methyltransferase TrmL [Clostridia bacterium]